MSTERAPTHPLIDSLRQQLRTSQLEVSGVVICCDHCAYALLDHIEAELLREVTAGQLAKASSRCVP